ncbi:MAG: hypothetical protein HY055_10470 [Magnetospirillum sp.]|nr:hypothetical protein [Magnetospirillum sp.]
MSLSTLLGASSATLAQVAVQPAPVAASLAAIAAIALAGRVVLGRTEPACAFAAGMGGFVLAATLTGVFGVDLRLALGGLVVTAAIMAWRDRATLAPWARVAGPVLLALMPLLLLLSDRRGSEWDEFSHWLHAFRYLAVNHVLPGGPLVPVMESCCAAYPYGWPLVGLAAMSLSGFSEAMPALLNTLMLALFAMLLLRLAQGEGKVSVRGAAIAALAATLASPTFVAKLAFSAYADVATAFLAAILALMGERLAARDGDEAPGRWAMAFGLAGAALMAVKPGNTALFGCVFGGTLLLSLRQGGWRALLHWHLLPMLALPAAVVLLWRWHVGRYLSGQEMVILPMAHWHVAQIPLILKGMADVAVNKGGHFGLGLVMLALGLRGLIRNRNRLDRLCALAGMMFLGYNLFLLVTYVVVFGDYEALHVASFWRYNTHLGMAIMLPAAIFAGRGVRWLVDRFPVTRKLGWLVLALAMAGPLVMAPHIRFDADPLKAFMRHSLHEAGIAMPPGAVAVVVDPSGSGLTGVFATYEWSGRAKLRSYHSAFNPEPPLAWLDRQGVEWAFIASGQDRMSLSPLNAALLVHRQGGAWVVADEFPYPGGKIPERWP